MIDLASESCFASDFASTNAFSLASKSARILAKDAPGIVTDVAKIEVLRIEGSEMLQLKPEKGSKLKTTTSKVLFSCV